jgi:hypothetical protein
MYLGTVPEHVNVLKRKWYLNIVNDYSPFLAFISIIGKINSFLAMPSKIKRMAQEHHPF